MDVIINVLNRLFNEKDTELYIGNKDKIYPVHNKINKVLNSNNNHSTLVSRKNKGKKIIQNNINNPEFLFNHKPFNKVGKRHTRKIYK